jgi:methyl-accepting chemotaxis protein
MSTTERDSTAMNTGKGTSIKNMTPEQTAEAIKNIARNIRESSYKMREAVRAIRQSGAIDELSEAVKEATIAARDTAKEINDAAKDMKERGVIRETISAAEEVNIAARETAQTVRETVSKKPPAEVQPTGVSEKTTARTRTKENPPL